MNKPTLIFSPCSKRNNVKLDKTNKSCEKLIFQMSLIRQRLKGRPKWQTERQSTIKKNMY